MNLTAIIWENHIRRALDFILGDAKKEILISTFKLDVPLKHHKRPINDVIAQLIKAQERKVDIKILLNYNENHQGTANHNLSSARWISHYNLEAFWLPRGRCVHAKFIIVDGRLLLTGSHNLTNQSLTQNFEVSLLIRDPDIIQSFRDKFLYYLTQSKSIMPSKNK